MLKCTGDICRTALLRSFNGADSGTEKPVYQKIFKKNRTRNPYFRLSVEHYGLSSAPEFASVTVNFSWW